jgi:hypothetical protein
MSQKYMVMGAAGPKTKNDCAGESQQQFTQLSQSELGEVLHDSQSCETEKYNWTLNQE